MPLESSLDNLTAEEFKALCHLAKKSTLPPDSIVFSEADEADQFYIIGSGSVSIYIQKYERSEDIATLGQGDCFGEMAILNGTRRTAFAKTREETILYCIDKDVFKLFLKEHNDIGQRVYALISRRNEELALKESVLDSAGFNSEHLHVSIKGDPSLRETVFNRERYDSIVDNLMPELLPNLEAMLLERNVYRVFINFNSAEVRVNTVFDPFTPETHAANKLTSKAYLDRHFPILNYAEKTRIIRRIYSVILDDSYMLNLVDHWQNLFLNPLKEWQPVSPDKIRSALNELTTLRALENYYLRNICINTVQDVIRMQFNCDGTHIVNSDDYQRFLKENLI